jgi:hypothetical protein
VHVCSLSCVPHAMSIAASQWRTEGEVLGGSNPPPRNSKVLTKLSQIPSSVENTSLTV